MARFSMSIHSQNIWALLLLFNVQSFCNISSDSIYLKNGQKYELKITEINSWGLRFSDGRAVMFKGVSFIETNNGINITRIKEYLPDAKISQAIDSTYVIDISHIVYPAKTIQNRPLIRNMHVHLLYDLSLGKTFGINMNFYPTILPNSLVKINFYFGKPSFDFEDHDMLRIRRFSSAKNEYRFGGLAFGLGKEFEIAEFLKLTPSLNYCRLTGHFETIGFRIVENTFQPTQIRQAFNSDKFTSSIIFTELVLYWHIYREFSLSIFNRYYFSELFKSQYGNNYNINLGIGYNFN